MRILTAVLAVALVPPVVAAQQATLVYALGNDTVAVEQYTRTASALEGEMVQRSGGAVTRFRYRVALGRNGWPTAASFARTQADGSPLPNGATETRFTMRGDSVIRENVFADSTQRRAFAARQAMIAFPTYAYGPLEVLGTLRSRGTAVDSVALVGTGGAVGYMGLESAGGDTLRLRGNVGYEMRVRFDAQGRLLLVDGTYTTNKVVATRGAGGVDIAALAQAMRPTGTLSPRETVRAGFGAGGMVLVDYSRPSVRERTVWGGTLVPFDSIWRAGANDATHLFTTRTLTFGELVVPPGSYTLWVQHTRGGTWLIVNRQTGQWGTNYDAAQDLGRVPLQMTATPTAVESFTIQIRTAGQGRGAIELSWGGLQGTAGFAVTR